MLVVGGGDSAVEAAVGLARQKGNVVTISYRKSSFFRIKKKNEDAVTQLIREKKIRALFDSQVVEIREGNVVIDTQQGRLDIDNDFVLIQIGGVPPYEMLKRAGVAFGGNVGSLMESGVVQL
jgi:thioredoxin reductase